MLQNSGNDVVAQIDWLENILLEVKSYGSELWDSQYADMLRMPLVIDAYMKSLDRYFLSDHPFSLNNYNRHIFSDLIRLERRASMRESLAEQWVSRFMSITFFLHEIEGADVEFIENLKERCYKMGLSVGIRLPYRIKSTF